LRAVAVVHVPINDQHARAAALLRVPGGENDVIEEAEAHRAGGEGVVAGRARNRECAARFQRLIDGSHGDAGRGEHAFPAAGPEKCVRVQRAAPARRQGREQVDVFRRMHQLERCALRRRRFDPRHRR
jgi:hypothetical protein